MSSKYPEADKVAEVKVTSQAIGLFLEWLLSSGNVLCRWQDDRYYDGLGDLVDQESEFANARISAGHYPVHINIEQILADYFEIDLNAYRDEQAMMLNELRKEK